MYIYIITIFSLFHFFRESRDPFAEALNRLNSKKKKKERTDGTTTARSDIIHLQMSKYFERLTLSGAESFDSQREKAIYTPVWCII